MSCASQSSWLDHPNDIWWGVQSIKLFVMQFSSLPCYLIPLGPKYPPQHFILENPQPTFLPQCEWPTFTTIQSHLITLIKTLCRTSHSNMRFLSVIQGQQSPHSLSRGQIMALSHIIVWAAEKCIAVSLMEMPLMCFRVAEFLYRITPQTFTSTFSVVTNTDKQNTVFWSCTQMENFMKSSRVGAELLSYVDWWTDGRTDSRFSQFCDLTQNVCMALSVLSLPCCYCH
jgi:hypothetical protein